MSLLISELSERGPTLWSVTTRNLSLRAIMYVGMQAIPGKSMGNGCEKRPSLVSFSASC